MAERTICKFSALIVFTLLSASILFAQDQFVPAAFHKAASKAADFYFIDPAEMDENTFDQIRLLKAGTLLNAGYSELTETQKTLEVEFLFDPTLESFIAIAGAQELEEFKITDPEGSEVSLTGGDFLTYSFTNQRIISGKLEKTGIYKATITGKGFAAITLRSSLKSATLSYDFKGIKSEFGKLEAYIRYSQYMSLRRKPKVGEELQCTLLVKSPSENLGFAFYSKAGQLIKKLPLEFVSNKRSGTLYRGACTIPGEPFRYVVFRTADNRQIAQRMMTELIVPAPAEVQMAE